jgi:hypothetical protein
VDRWRLGTGQCASIGPSGPLRRILVHSGIGRHTAWEQARRGSEVNLAVRSAFGVSFWNQCASDGISTGLLRALLRILEGGEKESGGVHPGARRKTPLIGSAEKSAAPCTFPQTSILQRIFTRGVSHEGSLARISDRATLRARGPRDALADEVRAQGLEGYRPDLPDADGGGDSATQWLLPKDNCGPWRAGSQQGVDCRVQKQSRKKRREKGDPCKKLESAKEEERG